EATDETHSRRVFGQTLHGHADGTCAPRQFRRPGGPPSFRATARLDVPAHESRTRRLIHLPFSRESYELEMTKLSPSGVRRDVQQALAELRTDLDARKSSRRH